MPTNVTALHTLESLAQFLGEGAQEIITALRNSIPRGMKSSDNLKVVALTLAETITVVDATTGAEPIALIARSNGTACAVHLYASDTATVGTDDSVCLLVSGTSGEISAMLFLGAGIRRIFRTDGSGVGAAAPTTTQGVAAAANDPDVWIVVTET